MKWISFLLAALVLCASHQVRAQDAATEERLNKLSGQIEDLLAAKAEQDKRMNALAKEMENLREQMSKPSGNYASQEEVRRLTEKMQELDKNREHDKEIILKEIGKLGKVVASPTPPAKKSTAAADTPAASTEAKATPEKGFEYTIQQDDTLSRIVAGCKEKNVKVTVDQILKANPGLKPERLKPGQKIFIPATS